MSTTQTTSDYHPTATEACERHMGIVGMVMKRYLWAVKGNGAFDEDDLRQAGRRGLMIASERFDPSKGFKFITFAAKCIDTEMIRAIDWDSRIVRVPATTRKKLFHQGKPVKMRVSISLETGFSSEGGNGDSDRSSMDSRSNPLNKMAVEHNFPCLAEPDEDQANAIMIKNLKSALRYYIKDDRNLDINMRFWFGGETLAQVGRAHGMSRQRAQQIAHRGRDIMRLYKKRKDAKESREDARI